MALQHNDFAAPDEIRRFGRGRMEVVNFDAGTVGKGTFEPGWRWSEHVAPIAGTVACQIGHLGYVIAGRMRVVMDDGSGLEVGPGEVFEMPPGHDAWTVGDEPCVLVDFAGAARYAVP